MTLIYIDITIANNFAYPSFGFGITLGFGSILGAAICKRRHDEKMPSFEVVKAWHFVGFTPLQVLVVPDQRSGGGRFSEDGVDAHFVFAGAQFLDGCWFAQQA